MECPVDDTLDKVAHSPVSDDMQKKSQGSLRKSQLSFVQCTNLVMSYLLLLFQKLQNLLQQHWPKMLEKLQQVASSTCFLLLTATGMRGESERCEVGGAACAALTYKLVSFSVI